LRNTALNYSAENLPQKIYRRKSAAENYSAENLPQKIFCRKFSAEIILQNICRGKYSAENLPRKTYFVLKFLLKILFRGKFSAKKILRKVFRGKFSAEKMPPQIATLAKFTFDECARDPGVVSSDLPFSFFFGFAAAHFKSETFSVGRKMSRNNANK
jgi:hypothetical protein